MKFSTGNVGKRIRVVWSFDNTAYPGDVVAWRAKRGGGVEHRVLYDNPGGKWAAKDIDRWHNLSKGNVDEYLLRPRV